MFDQDRASKNHVTASVSNTIGLLIDLYFTISGHQRNHCTFAWALRIGIYFIVGIEFDLRCVIFK